MKDRYQKDAKSPGIWEVLTCSSGPAPVRRKERQFALLIILWALAGMIAKTLLQREMITGPLLTWTAIVVPNLIAAVAVMSYLKFLRVADELLRKIQLEGLAIGFGAGAICALGGQLIEYAGFEPLTLNDIFVVMLVSWAVGQFIGWRRYQ